jgi:hypothetical protein
MHEVSLPRGPRDVDAAWMTSLLRAVGLLGSDADVASVSLEAPESQGNAGGALRARLRYAPASSKSPETLIVKLVPEGEGARSLMRETGFARAEVGLYRDLAPRLPVRTPRCYFAAADDDGHAVLVLEDLGDVRATWPGRPIAAREAALLLASLADLHAQFWNDPALLRHAWLPSPVERTPLWERMLSEIDAILRDVVVGQVPGSLHALIETALPRLPRIAAHASGPPFTLTHGDFTHRNVALLDAVPVAFDWQLVQRTRGARDVAYLLPFLALDPAAGETALALVDTYHARLVACGVHDYARAELARDQRIAMFEVMLVGLATLWPGLRRARAERRTVPIERLGLFRMVAAGVEQLRLVETLSSEFPL